MPAASNRSRCTPRPVIRWAKARAFARPWASNPPRCATVSCTTRPPRRTERTRRQYVCALRPFRRTACRRYTPPPPAARSLTRRPARQQGGAVGTTSCFGNSPTKSRSATGPALGELFLLVPNCGSQASAGRRRTSREDGTDQHGGATPSSAVDPPLPTAAVPARGDGVLPSAAAFQAVSALWHGFRRLLHRPRSARRRFSPARDPAPAAFHAQDGRDGPLPARLEVGAGGRSRAGACTHHDAGATDLGRRRSHLPRRVRAQDGEAATRRAARGNSGRSPFGTRGEAGGSRARGAGLPGLKPRGSGLAVRCDRVRSSGVGCPSHAREQVLEGAWIDRLDEIVVEAGRPCLSLVLVPTISRIPRPRAPSQ